jgi:hypothetical protein
VEPDREFNKRRRRRKIRRALLKKLIDAVLSGNFNNTPEILTNVYNRGGGARRTYHSPVDRSMYDYGYMEMDEMSARTSKNR